MPFDVGVDIGGSYIKLGLVDEKGGVRSRVALPTRARRGSRQALARISEAARALAGRRRIRSIGVGIAGLVDHMHGIVRVPPNLPGWNGTPVKASLEELTGLPVFCGNDVNAVTLGEWLYGAGQGCSDLLCVTLGTGVGGGIIVGGRLLLGANHAAGELGHTAIFGNGLPCRCGATGCVERYVGSAWVVDRARKRIRAQLKRRTVHRNQTALFAGIAPVGTSIMHDMVKGDLKELTTREIGRAARKGDRLALALVEETGNYLGLALASAVQLVDPERVIIGGGVARMGAPLLRAVRRTMSRQVMMFPGRRLDVVLSRLSSDAGIVGAACFRLAAARFSR